MNLSTTYIANIVPVIAFVLPIFGIEVADEGTLTKTLTEIAGVIGAFYVFIGRYRAGGITAFGFRKKTAR